MKRCKLQYIGILFVILGANIALSETANLRIDAGASKKPVRFHNFYGGYHHNQFYYEIKPAFKKIHEIFKETSHKRPTVKFWRCQNIFTYRNDPSGPDGLRWATEKVAGHCYDTERYASTGGYNWTRVNEVFDELIYNAGFTPVVEFNYMPECMAKYPDEIGSYDQAIISPPRDYNEWRSLIKNTGLHFQERFGTSEIRNWYFGVWNEPNHAIFFNFEEHGYDEFIKLYDYSSVPIKEVDSQLRIGGPDNTSVKEYSQRFVQHSQGGTNYCNGQVGSPADYFSIHFYMFNVRGGCIEFWRMARDIRDAYGESEYQNKRILITEAAPHWAMNNVQFVQNRYTAIWWLALVDVFLEAADLYGEFYMPASMHYCGILKTFGRRSLMISINEDEDSEEILKTPLFNLFEALSYLSDERIPVEGCDFSSDYLNVFDLNFKSFNKIRCLATRTPGESIEVLTYHFDQDDRTVYNEKDDGENPAQPYGTYYRSEPEMHQANITIDNIPFTNAVIKKFIIDKNHSNAYAYHKMNGETENFQEMDQHDDLELVEEKNVTITNGQYQVNLEMQQNSMILLLIEDANKEPGPRLGISPTFLNLGNNATQGDFTISNYGDANLNWSAASTGSANWISSISPASGVTASNGGTSRVQVTVNRNGLVDGQFNGKIAIDSDGGTSEVEVQMQVGQIPLPNLYRINAGGSDYEDTASRLWSADRGYSSGGFGFIGGKVGVTQDLVTGTQDQPLYQTERYDMTAYRFDVPAGEYQVVLHFADLYFTASNERVFSVEIEGETKLDHLDMVQEAGHDVALSYTFDNIKVTDGQLDVVFVPYLQKPKISAIEVIGKSSSDTDSPNAPVNIRVINP